MNQYFVEFKDYTSRVCEWGDKSNPEIICFHGLGSTNLSFIELAEMLKDKYHILSFDMPGHGKTPSFDKDEDYGASNLTNWVVQLIDKIGKNRFHILAHSWGASVALHYAAECPDRVNKMLLIDGGYHKNEMQYDYFTELYNRGEIKRKVICSLDEEIEYYEKDFNEYIFDSKSRFLEADRENYSRWSDLLETAVYDLMLEEDGKIKYHATGDTARAGIKFQNNVYETLNFAQIKSEILLLYADLPKLYFEIRELMIKEFKKKLNVTTKLYKNTTHMMHWDRPDKIAEEVVNWLK